MLYVYYGNPTAESQQSATNVWGSGGYVGVWHLNQNPGTTQQDATVNDFDGTPRNIDTQDGRAAGKIGPAIEFDGTNDSVSVGTEMWNSEGPVTFSFWNYVESVGNGNATGGRGPEVNGDRLQTHAPWTDGILYWDYGSTTTGRLSTSYSGKTGKWTHVAQTSEGIGGASKKIYLDGVEVASGNTSDGPSGAIDFNIGLFAGSPNTYHQGVIDQMTVANRVQSGTWIKTEYNNQSGRENFLTIGEAEQQSASSSTAASSKSTATSSTSSLSSPLVQAINQLYRTAYNRGPTFAEWKLWAERVIAKDKDTFPELLGAMQWQSLFAEE